MAEKEKKQKPAVVPAAVRLKEAPAPEAPKNPAVPAHLTELTAVKKSDVFRVLKSDDGFVRVIDPGGSEKQMHERVFNKEYKIL